MSRKQEQAAIQHLENLYEGITTCGDKAAGKNGISQLTKQ